MVQAIVFFVFGVAVTSFILVLVGPFLWRRALKMARKTVENEISLPLKEVKTYRDVLRAENTLSLTRLQRKYDALLAKYAEQKTISDDARKELLMHEQRVIRKKANENTKAQSLAQNAESIKQSAPPAEPAKTADVKHATKTEAATKTETALQTPATPTKAKGEKAPAQVEVAPIAPAVSAVDEQASKVQDTEESKVQSHPTQGTTTENKGEKAAPQTTPDTPDTDSKTAAAESAPPQLSDAELAEQMSKTTTNCFHDIETMVKKFERKAPSKDDLAALNGKLMDFAVLMCVSDIRRKKKNTRVYSAIKDAGNDHGLAERIQQSLNQVGI